MRDQLIKLLFRLFSRVCTIPEVSHVREKWKESFSDVCHVVTGLCVYSCQYYVYDTTRQMHDMIRYNRSSKKELNMTKTGPRKIPLDHAASPQKRVWQRLAAGLRARRGRAERRQQRREQLDEHPAVRWGIITYTAEGTNSDVLCYMRTII